jgi:molybdopterin converting factor small subunit
VTVRLWAAVADATGLPHGAELPYTADSLEDLLVGMLADHGTSFARVLPMCSVLVDGAIASQVPGAPASPLAEGATVDLLPPFAGG